MAVRIFGKLINNSYVSLTRGCSSNVINTASGVTTRKDKLYEKIEVEIRAHQPDTLKSYSWFATTAAKELDIAVVESFAEPQPHKARKTLLKTAFVNKKHRVQYEFRTYYHMMKFGKLTESTAMTFLEYIVRNLPEGVAMKVSKYERKKLPEIIEEHIVESSNPSQV